MTKEIRELLIEARDQLVDNKDYMLDYQQIKRTHETILSIEYQLESEVKEWNVYYVV